ncbi:zinc-dependent alcohol dehydrogenase family protein [Rhodoplanes sp. TEM]|uniref:alcohol dehydrogenase n=1 Tax=Rhodoplanes tepidamans TaxID=200616 RepID=A0ABT5JGW7_RHOTP|nr:MULTISPECIES: zinc-dependent alcohol dehydrogenase family protein [Rhodoplanes]MDC7788658.1 zinc-dependent alcohol dehydrogenase family protein [Rhodoplanes tepidamans]MDC7984392.1 zinc-dependent alcohol dehydrogenase family protein [Rhodoplanes sp. TEM]
MRAMVLERPGTPLVLRERAVPRPGPGEVLLAVSACGVCRTDLHVVDGELTHPVLPVVPGHEIVGRVLAVGDGVTGFHSGQRIGVPWLGSTCGTCPYCRDGRENLCDAPRFTGYTRDGGYATHAVADHRFCFPLPDGMDDAAIAPLLCAGLIGWRSYRMAGEGRVLGLYGFGAAAHILTQVAVQQGRRVLAFTRRGDDASQAFARSLGAAWAGAADEAPPEPLDAAIIFAPVGALVPAALAAVRKGGRVVCAGIHMSDIPTFPYALLWEERQLVSVANLTRADAREFFGVLPSVTLATEVTLYPLARADDALADLRAGRLQGAAVLDCAAPGENSSEFNGRRSA